MGAIGALCGEGALRWLLWAACVACSPRLASPGDMGPVREALPGFRLAPALARRVEGLAPAIERELVGHFSQGLRGDTLSLALDLVPVASACLSRRRADCPDW